MTTTYVAAMMDAESGGNQNYTFEAADDLFGKPAHDIVSAFMTSVTAGGERPLHLSYELNSVIKKRQKQVVMATGSLVFGHGEIPFLLMISPANRGGAEK